MRYSEFQLVYCYRVYGIDILVFDFLRQQLRLTVFDEEKTMKKALCDNFGRIFPILISADNILRSFFSSLETFGDFGIQFICLN